MLYYVYIAPTTVSFVSMCIYPVPKRVCVCLYMYDCVHKREHTTISSATGDRRTGDISGDTRQLFRREINSQHDDICSRYIIVMMVYTH